VRQRRGSPSLKRVQERMQLLRQFSPRSHGYLPQYEYNVLICTDADGVGVNLQDADTVINYDMPRGADVLVQRLGRIIRPTADPDRLPRVDTFVPSCVNKMDSSLEVQSRIRERYGRLIRRHEKSSEILGTSVLVHGESENISLDGDVKIEELLRHFDVPGDMEGGGSLAAHLTILEQYRTRAESLRHTLHSARYSPILEPRVFVLIKHADRYHPVVFDPVQDRVEIKDELTILNLICCDVREERAGVAVRDILRTADRAVQVWCVHRGVDVTEAERICALYLQPADRMRDLDPLLTVR
jgi:helicase-like protein